MPLVLFVLVHVLVLVLVLSETVLVLERLLMTKPRIDHVPTKHRIEVLDTRFIQRLSEYYRFTDPIS
jgi:hypothetical protein